MKDLSCLFNLIRKPCLKDEINNNKKDNENEKDNDYLLFNNLLKIRNIIRNYKDNNDNIDDIGNANYTSYKSIEILLKELDPIYRDFIHSWN